MVEPSGETSAGRSGASITQPVLPLPHGLTALADVVHENDRRLPDGNIVDFVRTCATRAIAGPQPIGYPGIAHTSTVPTVGQLTDMYQTLHADFDLPVPHRRATARLLAATLHATPPEADLSAWLRSLDEALGLTPLGRQSPQWRDRHATKQLEEAAEQHTLTIGDIAGALRTGKITLTTYHAAKGREWDYVILPGLVDGLNPRKRWNRTDNAWVLTDDRDYEQARSSFYVGLTRAKRAAILIEGTLWHSYKGRLNHSTPSTFVSSIREHAVPAALPRADNRR
jgi:DNA helicase-2/ATP-dependent DNA helicase PcrA